MAAFGLVLSVLLLFIAACAFAAVSAAAAAVPDNVPDSKTHRPRYQQQDYYIKDIHGSHSDKQKNGTYNKCCGPCYSALPYHLRKRPFLSQLALYGSYGSYTRRIEQ